jgi:NhaP-type Na+/H+ or K+/H+ antiporter
MADAFFTGEHLLSDVIRLFVIFTGITLSLILVRFAAQAFKRRETQRVWSIMSYAALLLSPALTGIIRFGQPLNWWSTTAYIVGLVCAIVALSYRVVLSPPWRQFKQRWYTRQEARTTAERSREDDARRWARKAEDDALSYDRLREDDVTHDSRGREDESHGSDHE